MWITICLKILVSVTTENISPSNRSDICTSSSASNLWKSSAPHYWETQAWQSSRARYQPNQWSSGASDFHRELQSKFTIDKKHEHCSKLHEQDSHCFDLNGKIPIKSRSTNLPLVPKLCQELSVKIPSNPGHSCLHPRLQWYGWRTLATWNYDSNLALNTKTSKTLPQPKQLKQHLYHTNRISFDWQSFRPRTLTPTSTQFFFSGAAASMTSAKLPPFASSWGSNTSETIHKR